MRAAAVAAAVAFVPLEATAGGGASAADAREFVTAMAGEAIGSLTDETLSVDGRADRFRQVMAKYFAVDSVARWVVGRAAWQRASDRQREEFVSVFKALLVETYAHRFAEYRGETLAVEGALVHDNGDVLVYSEIRRPAADRPLRVDWRVRVDTDGNRKVIDIIVEGLSMAQRQRAEFDSFLRRHDRDLSALIGELRRRIESARAQARDQRS